MDDIWTCEICTYTNEMRDKKCLMCEEVNPKFAKEAVKPIDPNVCPPFVTPCRDGIHCLLNNIESADSKLHSLSYWHPPNPLTTTVQQQQQHTSAGSLSSEDDDSLSCEEGEVNKEKKECPKRFTVKYLAQKYIFSIEAFRPIQHKVIKIYNKTQDSLYKKIDGILKASYPQITSMRGERNAKTVPFMIKEIYQTGLHMHRPPTSPVNSQVIPALRYCFAFINDLSPDDPKRVSIIKTLAHACQNCQQVQAREILRLYSDLTAQSATFEKQLLYSLIRQKEAVINDLITTHHKNCDLDHTKVSPWHQRAHLYSGYVVLVGNLFGLDGIVAAKADRFLSSTLTEIYRCHNANKTTIVPIILKIVNEKMDVQEWIQSLLADINNQKENADRIIDNDCIFKWADKKMPAKGELTKHMVFYDEARHTEYLDLDPCKPLDKNKYKPFLSPRVLVNMLDNSRFLFKRVG